MDDLDYDLLHRVQQLTDGANVHKVNNWLFCYQQLQGLARARYEKLLREFVASRTGQDEALQSRVPRNDGSSN
jgi:hypothetical protein